MSKPRSLSTSEVTALKLLDKINKEMRQHRALLAKILEVLLRPQQDANETAQFHIVRKSRPEQPKLF